MEYPYNLTKLQNISGVSDFFVKSNIVEFMGNTVGSYMPIYIIFIVSGVTAYTVAHLKGYDEVSSLAFASTLLFIFSLVGKLTVIDGIIMIPTYLVIFLGISMAITITWMYFTKQ